MIMITKQTRARAIKVLLENKFKTASPVTENKDDSTYYVTIKGDRYTIAELLFILWSTVLILSCIAVMVYICVITL